LANDPSPILDYTAVEGLTVGNNGGGANMRIFDTRTGKPVDISSVRNHNSNTR